MAEVVNSPMSNDERAIHPEFLKDIAALEEELGRHFELGLPLSDDVTVKEAMIRWQSCIHGKWKVRIRYEFAPENDYRLKVLHRPDE